MAERKTSNEMNTDCGHVSNKQVFAQHAVFGCTLCYAKVQKPPTGSLTGKCHSPIQTVVVCVLGLTGKARPVGHTTSKLASYVPPVICATGSVQVMRYAPKKLKDASSSLNHCV
jgi:hypothetical protein